MDTRRIFGAATSAALLFALSPLFAAQEKLLNVTQLQTLLAERLPKSKIVDVRPAPIPGLYEVFTGDSIFYSDPTGNYIVSGTLLDTRTKKNLTDFRVNERNAINFETLPFDKAIKVVKGDGSRKLAVFTDPDCPYCKRLEEEMKSINNVTMYLFMFPLKQLHPNAERHAESIWCADDSATAWSEWVLDRKEPADKTCQNPIQATLHLGEKLNVSGTPTIYFEDGSREAGAMKAADLEVRMNEGKKG
jgi:thiol:disulfide interchange protein DsbC